MNPTSVSFFHRACCKWCHGLPVNQYKYHTWLHYKDIMPESFNLNDDMYMLTISFMGEILKFKQENIKLKMGQFSYLIDYLKSNPGFHRKYNYRNVDVKKHKRSHVYKCPCGKSIWIDYCYSTELFPENNRKRLVK